MKYEILEMHTFFSFKIKTYKLFQTINFIINIHYIIIKVIVYKYNIIHKQLIHIGYFFYIIRLLIKNNKIYLENVYF